MGDTNPKRWHIPVVFFALLAVAYLVQTRSGTFTAELHGYPDEAAHYVTSLMAQQYIVQGAPTGPMAFAEDYYLHYPKVAIGHWPPAFYAITAGWMLVAGTSIWAVFLLQAVLAATIGAVLFAALRSKTSTLIACVTVFVWILLPVTQQAYTMVMAELLLTLVSLLAVLAFASYVESGRNRSLYAFAAWTFLAIMTKGSGFALLFVPALTPVLVGRLDVFRNPHLYLSSGVCIAAVAPWMLLTAKMTANGAELSGPGIALFASQSASAVRQMVPLLTPVALAFAFVGLSIVVLRRRGEAAPGFWAAMIALIGATYLFHSVAPVGMEPRRIQMAVPALLALAARGLLAIAEMAAPWGARAVPAGFLAAVLGFSGYLTTKPALGWRNFVASHLAKYQAGGGAILVAGGPDAENIVISEAAQRDHAPRAYLVRASKLLADFDWTGTEYIRRFSNNGEIRRALAQIPIDVIVLEDLPGTASVTSNQWHWHAIAEISQDTAEWKEVVSVAANAPGGSATRLRILKRIQVTGTPPKVTVDLRRMLGRVVESR